MHHKKIKYVPWHVSFMSMLSLFGIPLLALMLWKWACILTGLGTVLANWHWFGFFFHYIGWGMSFFLVSILEFQVFYFLAPKPGVSISNTIGGKIQALYYQEKYFRLFQLDHLPLFSLLKHVPRLQYLFFLAYSGRVRFSTDIQSCAAFLYDPDYTHIGRGTFIGSGVTISAHGVRFRPDGPKEYALLPVTIGERVTIGGESVIRPGVTMGEGAMLLPGSTVQTLTNIPAFEVWGGNPAVYVRSLSNAVNSDNPAAKGSDESNLKDNQYRTEIRKILCRALEIAPEDLPPEPSSETLLQWDSLGKLMIATYLENHFQIPVTSEVVAGINSMADIYRILHGKTLPANPPMSAESPAKKEKIQGDWLPLLPMSEATGRLMTDAVILSENVQPRRLWVAASFNAAPLAAPLKAWARVAGLELSISFVDYGQIEQFLLHPDQSFAMAGDAMGLVLMRPEDLPLSSRDLSEARITSLIGSVKTFMETHAETLLVVGDLPPVVSPFVKSPEWLEEIACGWKERLNQVDGVTCLPLADIVMAVGTGSARDPAGEAANRIPYATSVFQHISAGMARLLRKKRVPPVKVVVLDCDGILWGGAVAEEGSDGIALGHDGTGRPFVLFQQALKNLKEQGVLLALNSRNQPEDVWAVFDRHPDMVLKREDIAAARINWQFKSRNCLALANELNVGLDALLFIDDDPAQRIEVQANAPLVRVLPTPEDPIHYAAAIHALWLFDAEVRTAEDAERSSMMLTQQLREQAVEDFENNLGTYLHSLEIKAVIRPATLEDLPRISQLTLKTNQFNTSLKRRSLDEIKKMAKQHRILTLRAADRFGDYGLIGVAILVQNQEGWMMDTFLMSCRGLSRGLEETLLWAAWKHAETAGAGCVHIPTVQGPRNEPALSFLTRSGLQVLPESSGDPWFLMTRDTVPVIPAFVRLA